MTDLTNDEYEKISKSFSEELEALCKTYDVEHLQITAKLRDNPCCIQAFIPAKPKMWFSLCEKHDEQRDKIQNSMKDKVTQGLAKKVSEMLDNDDPLPTDIDDIKKFLDDLLG